MSRLVTEAMKKREAQLRLDLDELTVEGHRTTQGEAAAEAAVARATELICMVRDDGPAELGDFLDLMTRDELYGVVTALAAMVPDDRAVAELLAWVAA